jgi:hypothetical protein
MSCKNCGASELSKKLGKCNFCIWLSLVSSLFFWGFFYAMHGTIKSKLIVWPIFTFASLVTLLFLAHVLAFLSKGKSID